MVESETGGAWSFFPKNSSKHVTPQSRLCLISYLHESIKNAYNNHENDKRDPPSSHVYHIKHIA